MYIGSVKFFKNMILLIIVVIISTLLFFVCKFYLQAVHYKKMLLYAEAADNIVERKIFSSKERSLCPKEFFADRPRYQDLYPDFYAAKMPDPINFKNNTVYLTFDDGPSECTKKLIRLLDAKGVKATFFVIGTTNKKNNAIMKELVAHGHSIGMHSYSHKYSLVYNSVEDYLSDMYNIFKLIKQTTGKTPEVFRFPGGSINSHNYSLHQEIMAEMLRRGFIPFDWNVSGGDADVSHITKDAIVKNIEKHSKTIKRPIILLHDSGNKQSTVDATGWVIDYYRKKGYDFDKLTGNTTPVLFTQVNLNIERKSVYERKK